MQYASMGGYVTQILAVKGLVILPPSAGLLHLGGTVVRAGWGFLSPAPLPETDTTPKAQATHYIGYVDCLKNCGRLFFLSLI